MKYEELIKWCRKTIRAYNPVIDTIDTHSDTYLKKVVSSFILLTLIYQITNDNERVFIRQVFYGF